jgi:hypothetical protein
MSGESEDSNEAGATDDSVLKTYQFTITMPLIPSYKTIVADFCRNPQNGITGGFIRWQSMNTIYAIKLDCLCQGRLSALTAMSDLLRDVAIDILAKCTGQPESARSTPIEIVQQECKAAERYPEFTLGTTPHKVMDVWRKERNFVQLQAGDPENPHFPAKFAEMLSGGLPEISAADPESVQVSSTFYDNRATVHKLWLQEAKYSQSIASPSGSNTSVAVWRADAHATQCFVCSSSFNLFRRRHHCRRCGEVVCSTCSPGLGVGLPLHGTPEDVLAQLQKQAPQRICVQCEAKLSTG